MAEHQYVVEITHGGGPAVTLKPNDPGEAAGHVIEALRTAELLGDILPGEANRLILLTLARFMAGHNAAQLIVGRGTVSITRTATN